MAYDTDTRKRVVEYLNNGHTEEEAKKEFGISVPSMTKWRKILRETGSLYDSAPQRKPRKLPDEKLKAYVAAHPNADFVQIAAHFKCSDEGVRKASKRLELYKERDEKIRQELIKEINLLVKSRTRTFPF